MAYLPSYEATTPDGNRVLVIHLPPLLSEVCRMCGRETLPGWGLAIDSKTVLIVADDFAGEWGSVPCCEACYERRAEFVGQDTRY